MPTRAGSVCQRSISSASKAVSRIFAGKQGFKKGAKKHLLLQMSGLHEICGGQAKRAWCEGHWPLQYRTLCEASTQSNLRVNEHLDITQFNRKKGQRYGQEMAKKMISYALVFWNPVWNCVAPPHYWNLYAPLHYWNMRRRIIGDVGIEPRAWRLLV
jgi:hypothetical protein